MLSHLLDEPYINRLDLDLRLKDFVNLPVREITHSYDLGRVFLNGMGPYSFCYKGFEVKNREDLYEFLENPLFLEEVEHSVLNALISRTGLFGNYLNDSVRDKCQLLEIENYLSDRNVMDLIFYHWFVTHADFKS